MPSQITIGVIAALILSTIGLGWYAKHQTERAAVAQAAVTDAQAAGEAWRLALTAETARANDQASRLAASVAGYDSLRKTTDKRMRAYEQAEKSDKSTAEWGDSPVPAYVSDRLCAYADKNPDSSGMPADPKAVHGPSANACPGPDRHFINRDLWNWAEHMIEGWDRLNQDRKSLSSPATPTPIP